MVSELTGMRAVVSMQHMFSEALLELRVFEEALNSHWQTLSLLGELMREVADDVALAEELKRGEAATREMIKDRVIRAQSLTSQIDVAFGELCRAVRYWGVGERGLSNRPRSAIETPPPKAPTDDEGA